MKARFLALAALVLGLASCQNDFEAGNIVAGGEVDFQLSVGAPELATRAGEDGADTQNAKDSAFGAIDYFQGADWSSVDLRYSLEVYDAKADFSNTTEVLPVKDRQVIIVDEYQPVVFDLRLVPNREYRFVVFADFVKEGSLVTVNDKTMLEHQANLGLHHTIGADLRSITIKDDAINEECTDAYFAFEDIEITNSAAKDIVLRRPYGKVRVIATDLAELNLNVDPKAVKVTYTAKHPQTFNAVTGVIGEVEAVDYEFDYIYGNISKNSLAEHYYTTGYDAKTVENANGNTRHSHITLFTDYILAEPTSEDAPVQTPYHFTMAVYDNAAMADTNLIKETAFTTDIPVERNHLTTVIGNVLTTATEIEVRIDDNFAGELFVDGDIKDQLAEAAMQKNYVINLDGDFIWETGAAHGSNPLIPADAITETLTINGNGHKFIATGTGVGAIRLANGGKLILNDLTVVDQSEYHAERGETAWEFTYLEFAGETEFNNCVIDNTVALDGAKAVFNDCTFNDKVTWPSNAGQEYAAWVSNGIVHFNNCDINGDRGIKVHEAYGTEVEEVLVNESRFNNLSKKPGMAIGTVNAATKIEIKNSTFTNCQPGDQGLYMYETDTDVTTFDFSQTNNTVNATVATSEAFAKILKADIHTLNIALAADVTVDVSAHVDSYYFGGNNTNTITIDGAKVATAAATGANDNAYTLTFNHKNSDWNYIRFNNDNAKWVIKNVKLTNSGHNNGPWNRHDIRFYNDVVLENVTSDKAIALLADADLTNVVISDVHPNNSDAYALWITAEGQTVNIKDCALLAHESKSGDRGIKIDNEYVDTEAKVTLNVDGLKVKSQKKAAIMVNSKAGAHIAIKNIDLSEVADDKVNAVWVDDSSKDYFSSVSVSGASMIIEGLDSIEGADAQNALNTAVKEENAIVQLAAGEYTLPTNIAKGVTIICEEGTVFKGSSNLNIGGATIVGADFVNENGAIHGSTINGNFKNCTFEGKTVFRYCYAGSGTQSVFEDCYFKENGGEWLFHFDGGTGELICRRCTFDGKRVAIGSAVSNLVMEDCTFVNGSYFNTYCKTTITGTSFETSIRPLGNHVTFNNCTYYDEAVNIENLKLFNGYDCLVTIDDKDYAVVSKANNFTKYVEEAERDINVYMITHIFDQITILQKADVDVFIAGNGYTLRSVFIHGNARFNGAETLTFDNVHFSAFDTRDLISANSTGSVERYAHNVTIQNCSFEGDDGVDVVGLRLRQAYNVTIKDCTTKKLHSLGQITAVNGLTIEDVTIDGNSGLNLLTSCQNVNIKNTTINATEADGYGIRMDAGNANEVNLENSTITAYEPVVFRKASSAFKFNFVGLNTLNKGGDYHIVVASGVCPTLTGADGFDIKLP